jgi:DNA-binding NtrC family response regulator/predicted hydrocarbon binding protein
MSSAIEFNRPERRDAESLAFPDIGDLVARIHFAHEHGRIWLDDQRMVLLHSSALGVLRHELIESFGVDRARGVLTRIGYNSGARDAELAHQLRGSGSNDAINAGAQLHMLEGMAGVEALRSEIDTARGHYLGEYLWYETVESEQHIKLYGVGTEPGCWMQIGYSSGFASRFVGFPVLYRELECRCQGAVRCRILGKPVDSWDDAEEDLRHLRADDITAGLSTGRAGVRFGVNLPAGAAAKSLLEDPEVVGVSAGFNAVCQMVRRVADSEASVLFLGESGVGKEVLARSLHRISPRGQGPFVAINCAAIPEQLIESELFGVERGAFTGAAQSRPGRFERASGGTLFLDEIGILGWTAQGKLLRALQEREIERVGDTKTRKVDVRVVAATNLDLRREVAEGRFREDLYYRLNVFPVRVPPLRERREDIPIFLNHCLRKFNARDRRRVTGFTARAVDAMLTYHWPGNIRELENMVERGVILAPDGGSIDTVHMFVGDEQVNAAVLGVSREGMLTAGAEDIPPPARPVDRVARKFSNLLHGVREDGNDASLEEIETLLMRQAVAQSGGNLSAAARLLGITRAKLEYRLRSQPPRA